MGLNVAQKLIKSHLLSGAMTAGQEIGIRIDQTLTQDATGTLVMLELESMGLDRARTELSCQYVDHNLKWCAEGQRIRGSPWDINPTSRQIPSTLLYP